MRLLKTKKTTKMKNKVLTTLFSIGTLLAGAQSDSSYTKTDQMGDFDQTGGRT